MMFLNILFIFNLAVLSMDHFFTGTLAIFFPKRAMKIYSILFGVQIPSTKEYFAILKPWGALGIFTGIVGLLPIFDQQRFMPILVALVILLFLRIIYRFKFQKDVESSIKLSGTRNLRHIFLIFTCMSIIIVQLLIII